MVTTSWLGLGPVVQIGVVTNDLDAAVNTRLRLQPNMQWMSWTYGPDMLSWQRNGNGDDIYEIRLAICGQNPQLELIQPLKGDTSFARVLNRHGESLHHLGIYVDDFTSEAHRLTRLGLKLLESGGGHGLDGDGAFGYFDATELCGSFLEIIERPKRRPEPYKVFGPATEGRM